MKRFLFILCLIVVALIIYFNSETEVTKNVDSYVYDLPYKEGTKHTIVQGYGGMFSHKHKAALDFSMPEGTAIYAAREGVIYSSKDNSDEGGPYPSYDGKANYIIIKHSDGSFGCYWHLKKGGVIAKRGEIKKGQLIGYSGSTGFVLRPHLHFTVKRKLNYNKNSFVRTKFRTENGVEFLKSGETYQRPS
jgi:murein DD-endopeptidase MepM/ murein hydrolase activator NlpD